MQDEDHTSIAEQLTRTFEMLVIFTYKSFLLNTTLVLIVNIYFTSL